MGKPAETLRALAVAWRRAAGDLGIEVIAPYQLEGRFEFVALVRHFGSPKGMLILASWDEEHAAAAERFGFGYSCMDSPVYQTYDRGLFVEALTDWTWTGDPTARPDWYAESSDDVVSGVSTASSRQPSAAADTARSAYPEVRQRTEESTHVTEGTTLWRHGRARLIFLGVLIVALVAPATGQQCPAPEFYVLLPHNYPCNLIRVCSTPWGICAIPYPVQPGTPCHCRAANGAWLPGVCVR